MGLIQKNIPTVKTTDDLELSEIEAILIVLQNSKLSIDGKMLEPLFNAIIKLQKEYLNLKNK